MACAEIVRDGRVIGHVCGPSGTVQRVPGRRRKRWWCFNCRQRLVHTLMWRVPDEHYWPTLRWVEWPTPPWWECPQCHEEHVLFPGHEWEYDV